MHRISFFLHTCNQAWLVAFAALMAVGVYALGSVADPTLWRSGGTEPAVSSKPPTLVPPVPELTTQPSFQLPVPVQTTQPHN